MLDRVLLVGHDWGGFVGYLLILRIPERIDGYLALNIAHPWVPPKVMLPHSWRFLTYQPLIAIAGVPVQRHTAFLDRASPARCRCSTRRPRGCTPTGSAIRSWRALRATPTGRSCCARSRRCRARNPETRRATVPIRALFGKDDVAIAPELAAAETAKADDYTLEIVDGGHFIVDERPDLVRAKLIALAAEFPATAAK